MHIHEHASKLITKGRANLVFDHPFFGAICLRLEMEENATLNPPTAAVDGYKIYYHPEFIANHSEDVVTGILAHEALHVAMLHHTRMGGRIPKLWNYACDYAINPIIRKNGLKLPNNHLYESKFDGKGAEKIYEELLKDPDIQDAIKRGEELMQAIGDAMGKGHDPQQPIDTLMPPPAGQAENAEADAKALANTGLAAAKQAGKIPGGLEELINAAHEPQVNWKERLRELLQPRALGDQVWHKPYKRLLDTIYLPHFEDKPSGKLIWAVDTSGSVSNKELEVYASELQAIMLDNHIETATLLYIDTDVRKVVEFTHDDELKFEIYGRGGTRFEPGFKWVEENLHGDVPDAFLYFTDGEASFPHDPPPYPVIWCITGKIQAPWGDTIELRF